MHDLQIVPLSELLSERPPHGAALMPERDGLLDDDELDEAADATGELGAISATTGVRAAPASRDDDWLSAAAAAEALEVPVRHLRRLATAGKVEHRRDGERTMYRIAPWLAEQQQQGRPASSNAGETGAAAPAVSPVTCRTTSTSDELDAELDEPSIEVTGVAVRRPQTSEATMLAIDDSDLTVLEQDEVEKVVAEQLVETNRELMRLVEGLLGRWSDVNAEHNRGHDELRSSMKQTLQVQQCLQHWQHHAAGLERQILEKLHVAVRALDVADEALASRWTSSRRQRALRERLDELRQALVR